MLQKRGKKNHDDDDAGKKKTSKCLSCTKAKRKVERERECFLIKWI